MNWKFTPGTTIHFSINEFLKFSDLIRTIVPPTEIKSFFHDFQRTPNGRGFPTTAIYLISDKEIGDYVCSTALNCPEEIKSYDKKFPCYVHVAATDFSVRQKADEKISTLFNQSFVNSSLEQTVNSECVKFSWLE